MALFNEQGSLHLALKDASTRYRKDLDRPLPAREPLKRIVSFKVGDREVIVQLLSTNNYTVDLYNLAWKKHLKTHEEDRNAVHDPLDIVTITGAVDVTPTNRSASDIGYGREYEIR